MISSRNTMLTAVLGGAIAIALASGCSSATADQCTVGTDGDADCVRILGVATGNAVCDNGTCRAQGAPPPAGGSEAGIASCTSTEQCVTDNGGKASLCLEPNQKPCLVIENDLCHPAPELWKQAQNPIFIGALIDVTSLPGGGATSSYDATVEQDIQMAEGEWFAQTLGGFDIGGLRRTPVAIYCDIQQDAQTAKRAFDFVTEGLGAPAVITEGPDDVTSFIDDAVARGTYVYLTEYGSDLISLTGKLNGLVYTSYPGEGYSEPLMFEEVKRKEAAIRTARNLPDTYQLKVVALGSRDSADFAAYLDDLKKSLVFNGMPASAQPQNYLEVNPFPGYGSSDDYIKTSEAVSAFAPDIIVTLTSRDFHFWYLPLVEASWPATASYHAEWLGIETIAFPGRFQTSVGDNDPLRHRVGGVWNSYDPASLSPMVLQTFLTDYTALYKQDNTDEITTGYDAWYVTAYAIAAALGTPTVNAANLQGSDIGAMMASRLQSGTLTQLIPGAIAAGIGTVTQGGSIDLVGTTGDLDWDPSTGAADSNAGVWCVQSPDDGWNIQETGLYYDYKTKMITGDDADVCP